MTTATAKPLEQMIEDAEGEFHRLLAERRVKKGKHADECAQDAAAIVADANGLDKDSHEYEQLLSALDQIAADEFANDW